MSFRRCLDISIDTVVLRSPILCDYTAVQLKNNVVKKMAVDVSTGEQLYCFTTSELEGSYDYRIRIRIKDSKYVYDKGKTVKKETGYFLEVECSLHKLLLGHNVCGGSNDLYRSIAYLVNLLEYHFCVKLPDFHLWEVLRIDLAEIFRLPSLKAVLLYIDSLKNLRYPRRKTVVYDNECVYWSGKTTTLKIYSKGLEYRKHDFKRISIIFGENNAVMLSEIADRILRVEVEIKRMKLVSTFKRVPRVCDLNMNVLYNIYDNEVGKVLNGGENEMNIVRISRDVEDVLFKKYSKDMAKSLLGTWYMLVQRGEKHVKRILSDRTFYRHKKLLKNAGIAWHGSEFDVDYESIDKIIPVDFQATRNSRYCVNFVAPAIYEKLGKVNLLLVNF